MFITKAKKLSNPKKYLDSSCMNKSWLGIGVKVWAQSMRQLRYTEKIFSSNSLSLLKIDTRMRLILTNSTSQL